MTFKGPGNGKLTELVANHVFRNQHRYVITTVMHGNSQTDHVRNDHPIGIRLGVVKRHNANWYAAPGKYAEYLINDLAVRKYLEQKLKAAMISKIIIERPTGAAKVTVYTARPGIVIGKKGATIKDIGAEARKELSEILGRKVHLFLFVKVRSKWGDDPARYQAMGLDFPDR